MTLSPEIRTGPHIQFLAESAGSLNVPQIREQLLHATTVAEVIQLLVGSA